MDVTNVTADADTFTCNAYLVEGEHTTLVDAGAMRDVVDVIHTVTDHIDRVVITHQHGDHVECLDAVVESFDPAVFAYEDHPLRTESLADGDRIAVGDETAEVVFTPGHAPDHVSLVTDSRLFSGDIVVHDDGAFSDGSFGRTDIPGASRDELIESVSRLLERLPSGVSEMYSGHGGIYEGDVHAVVERALERAQRREPKYPEE